MRRKASLFVGSWMVVGSSVGMAFGQTQPVEQFTVPFNMASGKLDNPSNEPALVYQDVVHVEDVPWVRLSFTDTVLRPGSYLLITSIKDGASQRLDSVSIAQWGHSSAYFNGEAVWVQMYAGPATVGNSIAVNEVLAGRWGTGNIPESQCGPTDDRAASTEDSRGRLLDIGCTASIYTAESCMITAGHCLAFAANTMEFNVPLSLPNGTIVHPGPEDQYSVDSGSREFVDGGEGNDWGLFKVFPNSNTGLMPFEAQGAQVVLDTALPAVGTTIDLVGYGTDSGTANQTQQRSTGPVVSITGPVSQPQLNHQADTEGGNSGSSIISTATGMVVGIHTHAGCTNGGGGSNTGTGITHTGLQDTLVGFCLPPEPIGCEDIRRFRGRCNNNLLQVIVILLDSSHSGETVTISVDGIPNVVAVVDNRATLQIPDTTGTVTVTLDDPAGCQAPLTITCN